MSISTNLYFYNSNQLKRKLIDWGAKDEKLLGRILRKFGTFLADKYVLLNNESAGELNPYENLMQVLDVAFKEDNSFEVFIDSDLENGVTHTNRKKLMSELFPDQD